MEKRKTQWLKGLDFFDLRTEDIRNKIARIGTFYKKPLPPCVTDYLVKYKPLDMSEPSNFSDDVVFEWGDFFFTGPHALGEYPLDMVMLYDADHIIKELEAYANSTLENIHAELQIFPIAGIPSPDGGIVVSLNPETEGQVYYLVDFQFNDLDAKTCIAGNLEEFMRNIEIVPHK